LKVTASKVAAIALVGFVCVFRLAFSARQERIGVIARTRTNGFEMPSHRRENSPRRRGRKTSRDYARQHESESGASQALQAFVGRKSARAKGFEFSLIPGAAPADDSSANKE
jgi:hypothetical protein